MIIQPIETTEEERFNQFMKGFSAMINSLYKSLEREHTAIFNQFWRTPYSSQRIVDTLGFEQTMKLFQLSSAVQEILKADPDYKELVPPKNVDFSTGSILITDKTIV